MVEKLVACLYEILPSSYFLHLFQNGMALWHMKEQRRALFRLKILFFSHVHFVRHLFARQETAVKVYICGG